MAGHEHGHPRGPFPSAAPSIVYQQPLCSGTIPVARWGFSSAVVGSCMYVFGGVGPAILDDLAVLDVELMIWRPLVPSAARPKDRPEKVHAASMCAVGSTLWMFGGQQGRKHLRNLYSLDTDVLNWKLVVPAGAQPAAREGHTMTTVSGMVYMFGGQGKKAFNDMFILKPQGAEWVEVKATGAVPSPRSGHSMLWDGGDRLICFAGASATTTDNSLAVYSLSRSEWAAIQTQGTAPSPRTRHTAVLLDGRSMLVFGGCNSAGVFFNDAYLLNLDTWVWTRLQALNPPPPPRYHHCCHVVNGKVVLYGGVNPKQSIESVVLLQTSNAVQELSDVADELVRMTGGSFAQTPAASSSSTTALLGAAAGPGGSNPLVDSLMKLQLRDLLVKRNMEEMHVTAQQKAEAVEVKLKQERSERLALQKEVMQLQLMRDESEAAAKQLKEQLADTAKALARETAEHQATSAVLSDLRSSLESREQQLADARQLLDSMSAELGILASRLHRVQQQRDALRAERQQERQQERLAQRQASNQQQQQQRTAGQDEAVQPLTGAAAAVAQLQLASAQPSASQATHVARECTTTSNGTAADSDSSPEQLQHQASQTGLVTAPPEADLAAEDAVLLCPHGHLQGACLLCMCSRFLEATAGSCSQWATGSSLSAAAARLSSSTTCMPVQPDASSTTSSSVTAAEAGSHGADTLAACMTEAQQYRQYLAISELARNRLEAEHAALQQQVDDLRQQVQQQQHNLRMLQAHPVALTACTVQELTTLEGTLETSTKAVRQVVLQRSIAEYQKQASADSLRCAVCMEAKRSLAFGCGHQTCDACGDKITTCPFCRQTITAKIRLYE